MSIRIPRNKTVIFGSIMLLSFLLYGNGIGGDFVFDDKSVITGNPMIENMSGAVKTFVSPYHYARPQSGLYRPLTFASYTINWNIDPNPAFFHIINIFLNGLVAYLVFIIILNFKDRTTAAASAALFLLLPIHVESVTSIVGRAELLAALFLLLGLYSVLKNRYLSSSIFFLAALFSKETSIAFLPIFFFLEYVWKKRNITAIFKKSLFYLPSFLLYSLLRFQALGVKYFAGTNAYSFFNPIKDADFFSGLWTAFKVLYLYVQKTIFLTYFSSDYSYNQIPIVENLWRSWEALAGILIFIVLIYILIAKRSTLAGIGSVIFLSSYLVVSNMIIKIGTIMAERLFYLPSLGLVLILSDAGAGIFKKYPKIKLFLIAGLLILIIIYGAQIIKGNNIWVSEKTLFENAYNQAPNSVVNISNKASLLLREGKKQEALEKIRQAIEIEPKNSTALHLAGQTYISLGDKRSAERLWKDAIAAQADYLYPYLSLGVMYYGEGNFTAGESILSQAREMYNTSNVVGLLALNKIGLKKNAEAIEMIENYAGKDPKEPELRFVMGIAYLKNNLEEKARMFLLDFKDPILTDREFLNQLRRTEIYPVSI